jgi:hypothetical protein
MILGDGFIFFHMPRTGGTSVTHWLSQKTEVHEPIIGEVKYKRGNEEVWERFTTISHAGPIHLNREDFLANDFWFAFIRNPFDWYVSKWAMKFAIYPDYADFKSWLRPLLMEDDMRLLSKWVALNIRFAPNLFPGGPEEWEKLVDGVLTPTPSWDFDKELNPKDIKFDIGFMTHRYLQVCCAYPLVYFEEHDLDHDKLCMMDKVYKFEDGIENGLRDALEMEITDFPVKNTSERKPYQEYYDKELIDLVYYKDRFIFETYGYTFEG